MAPNQRGPLGSGINSPAVDAGTALRARVFPKGTTCQTRDPWVWQKAGYVTEAIGRARGHALPAIKRHTTEDFTEIIQALVPGLLIALAGLIATTLAGAGIGALFGGVGAGPGAALGFKFGLFVLNWLGLGFLVVYVAGRIGEVAAHARTGIDLAWNSCGAEGRINLAAREIAEAVGLFFSLLLQALVVYLARAAAKGKLGAALARLRNTRLFRQAAKLEGWLNQNYARLCSKYQVDSGLRVIEGARVGVSQYVKSLTEARGLLGQLLSQSGTPRFRTFRELHRFLRSKGMKVSKKEMFGPRDASNPKGFVQDAAQVIYSNGDGTVIVKVKTRGYAGGRRSQGTMSVEITDGGPGWENALAKLDRRGGVVSKNLHGKDDVVRLSDGYAYKLNGTLKRKVQRGEPIDPADFRRQRITNFEVIEGGGARPRNKDDWANAGHLDFDQSFDPSGAWAELGL